MKASLIVDVQTGLIDKEIHGRRDAFVLHALVELKMGLKYN